MEYIKELCEFYGIKNYTINLDGSINVYEHVDLSFKDIIRIPLKFNYVNGDFNCSDNDLTTLENVPKVVNGHFDCSYNKLTNLDFIPEQINGSFDCSNNNITSLKSIKSSVGGLFDCENNMITDLQGFNIIFNGYFICSNNPISIFGIDGECLNKIMDFKVIDFIRNKKIIEWKFNLFYENSIKPDKTDIKQNGYKI